MMAGNWTAIILRLLSSAKIKPATTETSAANGFRFSARSLKNLTGVHPELVRVAARALQLTTVDFVVTEGRRTLDRQKLLVSQGASKTLNSRHLTGHAIDVAALLNGTVTYNVESMTAVARAFKQAASELGVPIVWGGDWKSFKDTPHFELSREVYP